MREQLPDDAVVVRGGEAEIGRLLEAASLAWDRHGKYVLSVYALAPEDGEATEDVVGRIVEVSQLPNGKVRTTTAGALRAQGFALEQSPPDAHYHVVLADQPDEDAIGRFEQTLDPPIKNRWKR